MKEHPILFNLEMVRAVLDGRKTVTRRVLKEQPHPSARLAGYLMDSTDSSKKRGDVRWEHGDGASYTRCPYGSPGDRLWVRETHIAGWPTVDDVLQDTDEDGNELPEKVWYRADGNGPDMWLNDDGYMCDNIPWKPSIHMPRWASRILLEVVSVRVERVQEISEEQAKAEGTPLLAGAHLHTFIPLWDSINAKRGYGWDSNPWCWVVEFKRVQP